VFSDFSNEEYLLPYCDLMELCGRGQTGDDPNFITRQNFASGFTIFGSKKIYKTWKK